MKYNAEQLGALRKALLCILTNGATREPFGLCCNLMYHKVILDYNANGREYTDHIDGYDFVATESIDWPHAKKEGDGRLCAWFVPYNPGEGFWEGGNLEMRQNLIQYLLGRVAHHESLRRGGVALAG